MKSYPEGKEGIEDTKIEKKKKKSNKETISDYKT